jgi:alpha-D-ribose 1-methylphosphonate 5-triphosphate synthase subunit PhnI
MGYSGARGGLAAIRAAEELVRRHRLAGESPWLGLDQITERLRLAVDRVQGEGGLWAPELAARALRQAEGDVIEASQLVRSYRSTLPRLLYSLPVDADELVVRRRVVPAYRTPPGPQLLGRTVDYTGRLIDLTGEKEAQAEAARLRAERPTVVAGGPGHDGMADPAGAAAAPGDGGDAEATWRPRRLLEVLREQDLLVDRGNPQDPEPFDVTRTPARPGAPRSAWLAAMARAETGALVNLWYRNILGPDSYVHEITLGEVRHGRLPVRVAHPHTGGSVTVGWVGATEVEGIEDLDRLEEDRTRFDAGYGLCFGHNERKAIAMANLDISAWRDQGRSALHQSLLLTTDGLDASGFLEHLKLPHYVTFRSMVERKQAIRAGLAAMREHDHPQAARAAEPAEGAGAAGTGEPAPPGVMTDAADRPRDADCISSVTPGGAA